MDSTYYKPPWWRKARWIIPAAMILVVALIAAIVMATSGTRRPQRTATATPQACPVTTVSDTIPAAPPADLRWKSIGPMLVPTSATAGPARYQGDVWSCYAHSPTGAVMASYDIVAGLLSPDWRTVAERELAPGPGQDAYIRITDGQTWQPPQPGEIAQPVGFEVVSYTPQVATVETLADAGGGQYQAADWALTWIAGDWKLVMTPDGKAGPDPQLVTSANGFVLWGEQHA
jgi:hypothetical protein